MKTLILMMLILPTMAYAECGLIEPLQPLSCNKGHLVCLCQGDECGYVWVCN